MSDSHSHAAPPSSPDSLVLEIVRELSPLGVEPGEVQPDSELVAELGFDSLGLVELLVALEDALDLPSLEPEVSQGLRTVGDLQQMVQAAGARTNGSPKGA